jgi:hypothetical protein
MWMEEFLEPFLSRNRGIPRKKRLVLPMYELTIRAGDQWSMNQAVTRPTDCLEDIYGSCISPAEADSSSTEIHFFVVSNIFLSLVL